MRREVKGKPPLISIIIPVHNRKKLVFQAIQSALSQDYPKREVVVVDDGSEDGTFEALSASKVPISLYRHRTNKGQGAARNLGLKNSKGTYVLFLDSDDSLEPGALTDLWTALSEAEEEDSRWGACYGKMLTCDAGLLEMESKPRHYYSGWILPQLFFDNFVRTGTYLVRKSILEEMDGFKEDLYVQEDRHLLFRIAAEYKFLFIDRVVARYRRHGGDRARNRSEKVLAQGVRHLDHFFQEAGSLTQALSKEKGRLYAKEHLLLSKLAWREGRKELVLYHWEKACSYRKRFFFHPKYLYRAALSTFGRP